MRYDNLKVRAAEDLQPISPGPICSQHSIHLTTLEMLDLLEASLAGLRPNSVPTVPVTTPEALEAEMRESGLTARELARDLGLPRSHVEDWLAGRTPAPSLALSSIQLLRRLTASEHRKNQNGTHSKTGSKAARKTGHGTDTVTTPGTNPRTAPEEGREPANTHPFSRIEEL